MVGLCEGGNEPLGSLKANSLSTMTNAMVFAERWLIVFNNKVYLHGLVQQTNILLEVKVKYHTISNGILE
ncbi:hypothetical protein ANN_07806 [Periplaneta americana]|uniref:Uncharacterized protein n=1 Tax=Periplaneta americana TaxID=6978 RepID=A0ABQ8SZL7_PERAM|nr:hypothetical protein ANN_07806 [Periplaneta americana]